MGVGEIDLPDDAKASPISCSVCLEHVNDNGDRSWAKLQCGHQFHLDCIGSAFNIKGVMQCPNCRKIEKGQWLYASSSRSFPDVSFDDWVHDEDLHDLSYSEMSFGVQWCPFSGLTQFPSSFDEGENSINAYHDFVGQHVTFDLSTTSPASHPCPYIAYTGPIHHSSSSSGDIVRDSSSFNNHWNGPSGPSEMAASYVFPAMELHYTWENNPFPFSSSSSHGGGVSDQTPVPSMTRRQARPNSDMSRLGNFMHHFPMDRSAAARTGSSVTSLAIPPHPGSVARTRDRLQALQAYFHPSNSPPVRTPVISGSRRSNTHRGYSQGRHAATPSDQTGGFYYTTASSGGRNALETESHSLSNHFYSWGRENQNFFSFSQADRDPIWAPLQHPRHGR